MSALERLGGHGTFKSQVLQSVRDSKGIIQKGRFMETTNRCVVVCKMHKITKEILCYPNISEKCK